LSLDDNKAEFNRIAREGMARSGRRRVKGLKLWPEPQYQSPANEVFGHYYELVYSMRTDYGRLDYSAVLLYLNQVLRLPPEDITSFIVKAGVVESLHDERRRKDTKGAED